MKALVVTSMLLASVLSFAQDEHKKAYEMFKKGQYQDALVMVGESIASHPDWWFPVLLKGDILHKLERYKDAISSYNDALTLELPNNQIPRARFAIARVYMDSKDYPKAISTFTDMAPLAPPNKKFEVFMLRGQCEIQIAKTADDGNDTSKATSFYSKAINSFIEALKHPAPRKDLEIEALFQKAFSQYKIGNYKGGIQSLETSIQAFQDVIAENPKEKRAHTFLINLAFQLVEDSSGNAKTTRYNEAVSYINRYLGHWPTDNNMLYKKGLALQGAKNYKEAISVLQTVVKQTPNNGEALFSLASCQMADKQYKAAIGNFNKAKTNGLSANPNLYTYIAYSYQEQKSGCDSADEPLYSSAVKILEEGLGKVASAQKSIIEKDLTNKRETLNVLRSNKQTDNQNHLAAIENIQELQRTIDANKVTLAKNQEMYIQQPTDELKTAIDDGKETISSDEKSLDEQFSLLNEYINAARRCGGASSFTHFNDMVSLAKQRG